MGEWAGWGGVENFLKHKDFLMFPVPENILVQKNTEFGTCISPCFEPFFSNLAGGQLSERDW